MGSVIEKVQSRLPRIRRKAEPAEAAIGLLESVEVHSVETESRADERAYSSAMRHQQDGLAGVSCEEIIPKQSRSIVKAANGVLNLVIGQHAELGWPETPIPVLFGKATGYFFKRQTFPVVKFDLSQPGIGFERNFAALRTKRFHNVLRSIRGAPQWAANDGFNPFRRKSPPTKAGPLSSPWSQFGFVATPLAPMLGIEGAYAMT